MTIRRRVPVPLSLQKLLMAECNGICSVPSCPHVHHLEFHHIGGDPSVNEAPNLIVLCPNHHAAADCNEISASVCMEYKRCLAELRPKMIGFSREQLDALYRGKDLVVSEASTPSMAVPSSVKLGDHLSVLILDDEPQQAMTYAQGLELRGGIHADVIGSVEQALAEFRKEPFPYHLVVLDLWMPPQLLGDSEDAGLQTGALLLQEFRTTYGRNEPVIILSNVLEKLHPKLLHGIANTVLLDKVETRSRDLYRVIVETVKGKSSTMQPVRGRVD